MDRYEIGTYIFSKVMIMIKNMPEYHDEEKINKALNDIHRIYSSSRLESTPSLFESKVNRIAYMYLYFTGICAATKLYWLNTYNDLDSSMRCQIDTFIRKRDISICSIGGGPATDVIAFHSFLCSLGLNGETNAVILDSAIEWKYIANQLISDYDIQERRQLTCQFTYFNFTQDYNDFYTKSKMQTADVVSIVKFFSAVYNIPDRYHMLQEMVTEMKPGALLFVMDNFGEKVQSQLEVVFRNAGFSCIIWNPEFDTTITLHYRHNPNFEYRPQRRVKVFATLWIKNSSSYSSLRHWRSGVNGIDPSSVIFNRQRFAPTRISSNIRTNIRNNPYDYQFRTQPQYYDQSRPNYDCSQPTATTQSSSEYHYRRSGVSEIDSCSVIFNSQRRATMRISRNARTNLRSSPYDYNFRTQPQSYDQSRSNYVYSQPTVTNQSSFQYRYSYPTSSTHNPHRQYPPYNYKADDNRCVLMYYNDFL